MLTGELRSQVDAIWNAFWSGGISNPMEVMEQITYLLFLRRLDDLHTLEENKALRLKKPMERRVFPVGKDAKGRNYNDLRWSRFKNFAPAEMYTVVGEHVFPFLRTMGGDDSTYAHHMKDARFTIPTPALLSKVVDMLDHVPMEDRDTKGDLYEYMLSKIATAGQNGQFRTPRHIIRLMVELTAPNAKDISNGSWWRTTEYQSSNYQESGASVAAPFRTTPHSRHSGPNRCAQGQTPESLGATG
jgi:type I restriction enzyme M protein